MSHFVTIKTHIKDIEALHGACAELGVDLVPNAHARGYGNTKERGDYVIRLRGPFDIAVHKEQDSTYRLSTDWWDGHVEREVGKDYGRLLQLYGVHKATREAHRKGLRVQRASLQNNVIKLTLTT